MSMIGWIRVNEYELIPFEREVIKPEREGLDFEFEF